MSCLDRGCGTGRLGSVFVRKGCVILLLADGHDASGDDGDRGRVAAQCGRVWWILSLVWGGQT